MFSQLVAAVVKGGFLVVSGRGRVVGDGGFDMMSAYLAGFLR